MKKDKLGKNLNLKTAQRLTTSQQNLLTEGTSYSSSILSALKGLQLKNGAVCKFNKNWHNKKIGFNEIDSFWA
jgi:hypothetical protein